MSPLALDLSGISVRFGGMAALQAVDLSVEAGATHALIGPNGAGKSTLINVLTGAQRSYEGSVSIHGVDVTGWAVHRIAALGVARTFQTVQLMPTADVYRNVAAGGFLASPAGVLAGGRPAARPGLTPHRAPPEVEQVIEILKLERLRHRLAGELPLGHLRLVELGRALMMAPSVIVMDEPASGMTEAEREELMRLLGDVHRQLGMTLLIVEHQIDFLQAICRTATVLDRGRRLAHGALADVLRDRAVIEAYVGELV